MDSQLLEAINSFVTSQKDLIDQIVHLRKAVTDLQDSIPKVDKTPLVEQLQRQVADLQKREEDREAFINKMQQSVIAQLVILIPETRYKIGTAFERRKRKMEEAMKSINDAFS